MTTSGHLAVNTTIPTINTVDGSAFVGSRYSVASFSNEAEMGYNFYFNSGWKRKNADTVSQLTMNTSAPFIFQFAASSTADSAITFTEAWRIHTNGDLRPGADATFDIGTASLQVDNIFSANAVTVSDERTKDDIGPIVDASNFLSLLDPRIWSRKNKVIVEAIPASKGERQKFELVKETTESIEIIDGVPTLIVEEKDVEKLLFNSIQVVNSNGEAVDVYVPDEYGKDKQGKKFMVRQAHRAPLMHDVPDMEEYDIPAEDEVVSSHGRPHTGFMAQAVKQAMTDAGIEDWAGYAYHEEEDVHVLRLQELIAYLVKGWQEQEARIIALEGK